MFFCLLKLCLSFTFTYASDIVNPAMKNEKKVPAVDQLFWKINAEQYDDSILIPVTQNRVELNLAVTSKLDSQYAHFFYHTSSSLYTRIDFMTLLFIFIFSFK